MIERAAQRRRAVDTTQQARGGIAVERPAQILPAQLEIVGALAEGERAAAVDLAGALEAERAERDAIVGHARFRGEQQRPGLRQLGAEARDVDVLADPAAGERGAGDAERLGFTRLVQLEVLEAQRIDDQVQRQPARQLRLAGGGCRRGRRQPHLQALHLGHFQVQAPRQQLVRTQAQVQALDIDAGAVAALVVEIIDDELAQQAALGGADAQRAAAEALRQRGQLTQAAVAAQAPPGAAGEQAEQHQQRCQQHRAPAHDVARHRPTLTPRCRRTASSPGSKGCARSMATAPKGRR